MKSTNSQVTQTCLLVEDDNDHAEIFKRCLSFDEAVPALQIHRTSEGEAALQFLKKEPSTSVDLIVVDLNLPRIDGFELIRKIKNDATLKCIPIIVLTTSSALSDIKQAYEAGANSYLVKPFEIRDFRVMLQQFFSYWILHNHPYVPHRNHHQSERIL